MIKHLKSLKKDNNVITTEKFNEDKNKVSTEIVDNKNNTVTITNYEDGTTEKIKDKVVIQKEVNGNETKRITTNYKGGNPVSDIVKNGTTITTYNYKDGKVEKRPSRKVVDKGQVQEDTKYTYDDEKGTITEVTTEGMGTDARKITIVKDNKNNDKVLSEKVEQDDNKTEITYYEDGTRTEVISQKDKDGNYKVVREAQYNADGKSRSVTENDKKVESDVEKEQRIKKEQAAKRQAEMKALGIVNRKGAGQTRVGFYGQENLGTRKQSDKTYIVVGQTGVNGRELVYYKDKEGKRHYYTMAKGGSLLNETYVKNTNTYARGSKTKIAGGKSVVIVGKRGDKHGRYIAIDAKGNQVIVSGGKSTKDMSDRVILDNSYVTASDNYDAGKIGKTSTNKDGVVYAKGQDGKIWFFDKNGNVLVDQASQKEFSAVINDSSNVTIGLKKPDKLNSQILAIYSPESVVAESVRSLDSQIPVAQKSLWQSCKTRIDDISGQLSTKFTGNKQVMIDKCKTLFADLKSISNSVSAKVKSQIQKLMVNLRAMMAKAGLIKLKDPETPVLNTATSNGSATPSNLND